MLHLTNRQMFMHEKTDYLKQPMMFSACSKHILHRLFVIDESHEYTKKKHFLAMATQKRRHFLENCDND